MTTRLPAIIPSFEPVEAPANVVRLFGEAHDATAPETPVIWRGKYDMAAPHVSRQRRVNGFQNRPGDNPENFRTLAFENPSKPGQFSVGLLMETWPFGQQLSGTPSIKLWLHSSHDSMEKAVAMADSVALNNVFTTLRKMIADSNGAMPLLTSDATDTPFARPAHWTAAPARSAYIPRIK